MSDFEVAIYNQDVRDRVRNGERHRDLADDWSEVHYIDVTADDETHARQIIERRYPRRRGFVVEAVVSV